MLLATHVMSLGAIWLGSLLLVEDKNQFDH